MNGLNEIDESTFTYFSEIARLKRNITKMEKFENMLISTLGVMADDGVQVKMPDDGFGSELKTPNVDSGVITNNKIKCSYRMYGRKAAIHW